MYDGREVLKVQLHVSNGGIASGDARLIEWSNFPNLFNLARRDHDLRFLIRKFLWVQQYLLYISCKFGLNRTVGSLTIIRSDGHRLTQTLSR
ncbi:hypothetical protein ACE6H2_024257 [Prunus campanulata]